MLLQGDLHPGPGTEEGLGRQFPLLAQNGGHAWREPRASTKLNPTYRGGRESSPQPLAPTWEPQGPWLQTSLCIPAHCNALRGLVSTDIAAGPTQLGTRFP